ncbi:MAG: phosphatidate cytidylyltransferase [Planctomycetes bacterium]|nr:phosphatidate cytidylyltransferase [Planctomycetota bacterium]
MGKRFFFGFSMFFALLAVLVADHLLGVSWGFFVLSVGMCLGGIYELGRMFRFRELPLDTGLLYLASLALLGYVQLIAAPPDFGALAWMKWGPGQVVDLALPPHLRSLTLLAPLLAAVIFPLVGLTRKDVSNLSPRITNNLGIFLYVIFPIALILWLRKVPGSGPWLLYFLLTASRLGDVGAYLLGKAFGRHKLIPHLSAGKTVEGALAGLLFSAIGGTLVVLIANNAGQGLKPVLVEWWHGALLGGFVGIAAQSGDLVESGFKRAAGIKDSGQLVPSFGGVMDIMDNFMLTGPLILIVLALWSL